MASLQSQYGKPLHILDLPNEILAQIFVYVKDPPYYEEGLPWGLNHHTDSSVEYIKVIRLVCRRFRDESSHLLLTAVSVSMNSASLARLDEISRHPLIARGIQTVILSLRFFAFDLATEFYSCFLPYQWRRVRSSIRELQTVMPIPNIREYEGSEYARIISKTRRILDSWNKLAGNNEHSSFDREDRRNVRLIKRAHEEYRQAYLEQERVRTNGTFLQVVADAVARMPIARSLYITGGDTVPEPQCLLLIEGIGNDDLVKYIVRPMEWRDAQEQEIDIVPFELLSQIPLAIHETGVVLTGVNYGIAPMTDYSHLSGGIQNLNGLKTAMRQLTSFTFEPGLDLNPNVYELFDDEEGLRCLQGFVEACTDTDSIQDIRIDMGLLWPNGRVPTLSAGSLLLTRTWPRLRYVFFRGPLHFEELRELYAKLQTRVRVVLETVYLMSGSWVDVLDIMRDNPPPGSDWSYIFCPVGAERDTITDEQEQAIFGDPKTCLSTLYIRGMIRDNPLRQVSQDINDEDGV
ncbi:hypothetical protein M434DRAFT_397453 [Hypoxylon sp. CO27-5]|nr:hypothetical protein M434DRAFT_397453 [Hypoxylon sp. CO27-5]